MIKYEDMTTEANKDKYPGFATWLRRVTAGVLALSLILLLIGIIRLSVVPAKYLWIAIPIYGVITALIVWLLLHRGRLGKRLYLAICIVLAFLLTSINIYGLAVLRTTGNLLTGIQSPRSNYINYVIITTKDRSTEINSAKNIVLISTDPLYDKVYKAVANETPAQRQSIESLAQLKYSLTDDNTELATIREETMGIIKDQDPDFYGNLIVLRTFRVEADPQAASPPLDAQKPFAIYISGIDTYGDVSTVSRSDVNIVMVVNPQKRTMLLANTPRDYYVQLHGVGGSTKDKLTHAGIYGVDTSRQTLEDLFGISIPYHLRINFTSLVSVIDAVGPINVYSDYAFQSYRKGYNTLDSKQALAFARERYSFAEGDRQRGRNQQHIIEAIVAKMSSPGNATKLPRIIDSIRGSVDTNLSEDSLKAIVRNQLDDLRSWQVTSTSVDGIGAMLPTYSYGKQPLYVMIPDQKSLDTAKAKIAEHLDQ